jgi:tRNA modification GTPase
LKRSNQTDNVRAEVEPLNRAITLTPPGAAAIAVVRLAGPNVAEFLARHFSREPKRGRAIHGELRDGQRVIDDPVVVLHEAGDIADINLHGGLWVIEACLNLARRGGFEVLDPTSIPLNAAAVDASSKLEAEMLTHLPLARTELALRILLAQPRAWENLKSRSNVRRDELDAILHDRSLEWLLRMPRVAIVGAANVGKSTLANQLFAQERSITADLPGTTRDWVGEIANIDGLAVMLLDTPGQRQTEDAIERTAIAHSAGEIERADLVIVVLDVTRALEPDQRAILDRYPDALVVVNKIDRPAAFECELSPEAVRTTATTGRGVEELRRAICARFGCDKLEIDRPRVWTDRQRDLLRRALERPELLAEI